MSAAVREADFIAHCLRADLRCGCPKAPLLSKPFRYYDQWARRCEECHYTISFKAPFRAMVYCSTVRDIDASPRGVILVQYVADERVSATHLNIPADHSLVLVKNPETLELIGGAGK